MKPSSRHDNQTGIAHVKKSTSYRETFRRNRLLLSLPMLVAMLLGAWSALGAAKAYESTLTLWVDTPGSAPSSVANVAPGVTPPSAQEQTVLTELLATPNFVLTIGHDSMLGQYLAAHPGSGFGPSAMIGQLMGGGGSVGSRILAAFGGTNVVSAMPGPQVLSISFTGPTPAVAQSVLNTLVDVLQRESSSLTGEHGLAMLANYRSQVRAASHAVSVARSNEAAYVRLHRGATTADPVFSTLANALTAANGELNQAEIALNGWRSAATGGTTMTVLDPATLPAAPTSGKKKIVEGVLGGLFGGAVVAFLGTIALTRKKSDPWEEESLAGRLMPGSPPPLGMVPAPAERESAGRAGAVVAAAQAKLEQAGVTDQPGPVLADADYWHHQRIDETRRPRNPRPEHAGLDQASAASIESARSLSS